MIHTHTHTYVYPVAFLFSNAYLTENTQIQFILVSLGNLITDGQELRFIFWMEFETTFKISFLAAFAKLTRATISFVMFVCLSVCAHGTSRLPKDGFFTKLDFWFFTKLDIWFFTKLYIWFFTKLDIWFFTKIYIWFFTKLDIWFFTKLDIWFFTKLDIWFFTKRDIWFFTKLDIWFFSKVCLENLTFITIDVFQVNNLTYNFFIL